MATNWTLYNKRLNINGTTKRERDLYSLQDNITKKLPDSLSCKAVKINGIDRQLELVKTTKDYEKVIHSLPNETFDCGDYILYKAKTYLVTEIDADNDVSTTGKMQECNFTLKFQSPTGTILSYPCIASTNTSVGIDEGNVISTLSGISTIKAPFDSNTIELRIGKRFFLDRHPTSPTPYEITKVNNTEYAYGSKGLIELTLKQDELRLSTIDRVDLGVCDYFTPTEIPEPLDPLVSTIVVDIRSSNTGFNDTTKLGLTYNFSSTFKNQLGVAIANTQPKYTIDNTYGGKIVLTDNNDATCTLKVPSNAYDLLTKQFTLTCMDMFSGFSSSILLTIVGLY